MVQARERPPHLALTWVRSRLDRSGAPRTLVQHRIKRNLPSSCSQDPRPGHRARHRDWVFQHRPCPELRRGCHQGRHPLCRLARSRMRHLWNRIFRCHLPHETHVPRAQRYLRRQADRLVRSKSRRGAGLMMTRRTLMTTRRTLMMTRRTLMTMRRTPMTRQEIQRKRKRTLCNSLMTREPSRNRARRKIFAGGQSCENRS